MTRYGTVRYSMTPYRAICLVLLVLHTFLCLTEESVSTTTATRTKKDKKSSSKYKIEQMGKNKKF